MYYDRKKVVDANDDGRVSGGFHFQNSAMINCLCSSIYSL